MEFLLSLGRLCEKQDGHFPSPGHQTGSNATQGRMASLMVTAWVHSALTVSASLLGSFSAVMIITPSCHCPIFTWLDFRSFHVGLKTCPS